MSRKRRINKFLEKYFKKTRREKTLKIFLKETIKQGSNSNKTSSSNKVKLSFAIQKPPEKKMLDIEPIKKNNKKASTLPKKKKGSFYSHYEFC